MFSNSSFVFIIRIRLFGKFVAFLIINIFFIVLVGLGNNFIYLQFLSNIEMFNSNKCCL